MAYKIAIEVNNQNFKIVVADFLPGASKVTALKSSDFKEGSSAKEIGELIKKSINELKIKPSNVCFVLPQHQITVKTVRLPSQNHDELKGMVDIQTIRLIPYAKEEINYNFQILAKENTGYSWVRIAIAHKNVIERIVEVAKAASLNPGAIYLSIDSALHWQIATNNISKNAFIILNIAKSYVDIGVILQGLVIFSRSVSLTNQNVDQEMIFEEVKKTLMAFKKEDIYRAFEEKFSFNFILLMGINDLALKLKPQLNSAFQWGVDLLDENLLKDYKKDIIHQYRQDSFCSCLGALFNNRKALNLLPLRADLLFGAVKNKNHIITVVSLVAMILAISAFVAFNKISHINKNIAKLQSTIDTGEFEAKDLRLKKSRLEILKKWNSDKRYCIEVLKELYEITPDEINLSVLNYDINTPLILQGSAAKMSDIFKYVSILENSDYFKNVEIRYATKRKVRARELADFQINCPFAFLENE